MKDKIINKVSDYYGVTDEDMKNKRNPHASDMLCYMLKKHTDMKISDIGRAAGKNDHVTVVTGIKRIEDNLHDSTELQTEVRELEQRFTEEDKVSAIDKFFDLLTLEPVEDFKPGCTKKVTAKIEMVIRILLWGVTFAAVYCIGVSELRMNLLFIFGGVILTEFIWSGFKRFVYVQDIIIHSISVLFFVIATLCFHNYLAGLAIMGIAKCFSDFEYRNLYYLEHYDMEVLEEWERYLNRNFKMAFLTICIACFVVFKLTGII